MDIPPQNISRPNGLSRQQKRFYFHTLSGILFPLIFVSYYFWTYIYWLQPGSNPSADVDKPIPNGLYIWWSWFVIGALGINISNYTLAGVEAAMMMGDRFKPKTKERIKMQRDKSWSTLQAWAIASQEVYDITFKKAKRRLSGLWVMLFMLSILSWVFVLSGLSMETYSGYRVGNTAGTNIMGINQRTMNKRPGYEFMDLTAQQWRGRASTQIPFGGALYVRPESSGITNVSAPNSLPEDASSEIFLTSQATVPITGQTWGVALKYNCTGVNRLDQFTILNRRINSSNEAYVGPDTYAGPDVEYFYTLEDGSSISVLSQLRNSRGKEVGHPINIIGFAEIGLSTGFGSLLDGAESWGYGPHLSDNTSIPSSHFDEEEVFEFALWQAFINIPYLTRNFTNVEDPILELENEYSQPEDPFPDSGVLWNGNMKAIGVRCTSSSVTGTARVNGLTGTFTDFEREDAEGSIADIPRLGMGIPLMFLQHNETISESKTTNRESLLNWALQPPLQRLGNYSVNYTIVSTEYNLLQPLAAASNYLNLSTTGSQVYGEIYNSLIQMPNLQRAITAAYQQYAMQLMFQGASTLDDAWYNGNVTGAEPWTLIRASGGGIPPLLILVPMLIWALACVGLSLIYGFRIRWAETFDDYFLFCFSKEARNADLRPNSLDFLYVEQDS